MPTTPEEWLPILAKQLDARIPEITKLRKYAKGQVPLPEMGANLRASWEAFQKKSRLDYGGLAIRAMKSRLRCRGVTVPNDDALTVQAERIFRDNRLARQFGEAIVDKLETRYGYLVVGRSDDGKAVVTREAPETFTVRTDPARPWRVTHALKVTRDEITGTDTAVVWVPGVKQSFARNAKDANGQLRGQASGDWSPGTFEEYEGRPPVVALERELGFIEPHLDLIDSIVLGKLQRLVITAMQAYRQRALKVSKDPKNPDAGLPREDEDGNDIDYQAIFEPSPGALWELPEGVEIWESQALDMQGLHEGEKADRRDFAAVTSTPLSVFIPEGQNQSAEGAANTKEGHIALAEDELVELVPALSLVMVYALRAEGVDLEDHTVQVEFAPPALISLSEKFDAASKATGVLARRTIQKSIIGMTSAEIAEDEVALADEQLNAFIVAGGGDGAS